MARWFKVKTNPGPILETSNILSKYSGQNEMPPTKTKIQDIISNDSMNRTLKNGAGNYYQCQRSAYVITMLLLKYTL